MKSKNLLVGRWIFSALLVLLFSATGSFAESNIVGNIHQGNVFTGGSFTLSHNDTSGASQTTVSLVSGLEYFVIDRLSIGGNFTITHVSSDPGYTAIGVGPSATYHFFAKDNWSAYFGANALYNNVSFSVADVLNVDFFSVGGKLGLNYFFTPSVALGPQFFYTHAFDHEPYVGYNNYGLSVSFGIYL